MTNEQAVELYNLVNQLKPAKNSHQELAQTRTLRNMKEWSKSNNETIQDLRDAQCATKDVDGAKILLKTTLKRSVKKADGVEETEEFQVNQYTQEGEKALKEKIRAHQKKDATGFQVYSTYDDSGLSLYEKDVLTEYGFIVTKEQFEQKTGKKVDETPTPPSTDGKSA